MPKKKKGTFIPKKKKTLVPEPNWDKLKLANTEEEKLAAFVACEEFVHHEITDREYLHWLKKWLREYSGWDVREAVEIIPDVYLISFGKHGWKAVRLGFIPEKIYNSLRKNLFPLLMRAEELKRKNTPDPAIHESVSNREPDYFLHPDKVKGWIDTWKAYLQNSKHDAESNDINIRIRYQTALTYVANMQNYLRTGIWNDSRFGEKRESKIMWVVKSLAYDNEGNVKRTKGFYYPDIQGIWE